MRLLSQLPIDELSTKTVIVRLGFNVPIDKDGHIIDNFRIKSALPTLKLLSEHAKQVIIFSHIGRGRDETLAPVAHELQRDFTGLHFTQWRDLQPALQEHRLILVENIRQDPRETSRDIKDREALVEDILRLVGRDQSIFVQDAFSVCHRRHASIVDLPRFLLSYAGLLLEQEVKQLTEAINPPEPSLFILGGAKFATKEPLIRKFLKTYDKIFIAGAIANEFFKERGYEIGRSLVYDAKIPHDILYNKRVVLPNQVLVADADGHTIYISPDNLMPDMRIVDVVLPQDLLKVNANDVSYMLWNGPLGYYEGGYTKGTESLLNILSKSKVEAITGGGDTLATIGESNRPIFTYISVGGGAMLKFLQDGQLPGIEALN